jgi:hypothetical protein
MTESICVLDKAPDAAARRRPRQLTTRKAIVDALARSRRSHTWVLRGAGTFGDLIRAMSQVVPGVRSARLIAYVRPEPGTASVIDAGFERVLLGAPAMIPFDDLREVLDAEHPEDYCVGAEWDGASRTVALWLGDLSVLVVPMEAFPARGGVAPDPTRLSVEDSGQTIRMGEYEASVDAILFERDPEYRRRARKRMRQEERGLGPSIRRLRIAKGVGRDEFPGLDAKTLARIERGEVGRPQRATLAVIAKRLGVRGEDLGGY